MDLPKSQDSDAPNECVHEWRMLVYALKCSGCGAIEQHQVDSADRQFARLLQAVHQGKLPADYTAEQADLTDEQRQALRNIEACKHLRGSWTHCCEGKTRWQCAGCGRRWAEGTKPTDAMEVEEHGA